MKAANEKPVTESDLRRQFKWQDIAIMLAILGGFGSGYVHLIGTATAQADQQLAPMKVELEALHTRFSLHEKDAGAVHMQLKMDVHETQMDIRALYKAVMTGQKQPRLEAPPIDAGE